MEDVKPDRVKKSAGIGKGTPGPGRPKGAANKENKQLREMILGALDELGGVAYLKQQAIENPGPFMSLLGKVLPMQVSGEHGGAPIAHRVEMVIVDPAGSGTA